MDFILRVFLLGRYACHGAHVDPLKLLHLLCGAVGGMPWIVAPSAPPTRLQRQAGQCEPGRFQSAGHVATGIGITGDRLGCGIGPGAAHSVESNWPPGRSRRARKRQQKAAKETKV